MTAPTYELSKFLCKILQQSLTSKYNIKSSFEFCKYINTVKLPNDYILVSLDVVSLYTNIPKNLMIDAIFKRWDTIETDINLSFFSEIIEFCINCSYFQFQENFYLQIEGTAMGNPFSPVVADYVTEIILDNVTSEIDFPIPVLKKYVDDLVLAVPKDKVNEVVAAFNKQNTHIQFTVEMEVDGRLPFLDMVLVRDQQQQIRTEWYRKPVSSGRFLNYHSYHPLHHKVNVAANFVKRVLDFSTNIPRSQAMTIIHQELRRNDYPKQLVGRMINRYDKKTINTQNNTTNSQNPSQAEKLYFSLTNVNNLTSSIQKILHKDYTHITVTPKHTKTVSTSHYEKIM